MTRTKSRIAAALLSVIAVIAATVGMAAPASATPLPPITFSWQVLIGSTWTTLPFGSGNGVQAPAGVQQSRIVVTNNTASNDATVSDAWAGSSDYDNGGTQGVQLSDCTGYAGSPLALPAGESLTCTSTYNFLAGNQYDLYGFTTQLAVGGQDQLENQEADYIGVDDSATETAQATNGAGTFLASTDPALQTLPAGYTPQVKFNFTNAGASENLTDVTYSSTGTASLGSACPSLATTWVPSGAGSGSCTVGLANPASVSPQTVTISATGTGAFGAVTTTQSFTYAATAATCTVSATTFNPGNSGTISCTGFQPNITIGGTLHSVPVSLGSVSTGAAGAFTLSFVVPKGTAAGTHTISIDGGSTALVTSDPFTVGVLAATGVDVAGPLGAAGVLLAVGGVFLFYRRSRSLRTR
ncbi:MAG TPA: LPXTG cell wall anchor domain-containing protein [Galbitalea sp.]|nr:LPXTG cell wall anchor domain-containing protein [Galbitalea sp.]